MVAVVVAAAVGNGIKIYLTGNVDFNQVDESHNHLLLLIGTKY